MNRLRMKALDCFCGLGGWSEGLHKAGFDVRGIDVVDVGYPYDLTLADIRTLNGRDFAGQDLIVGSPPCRDFTKLARGIGRYKWKNPPDIKNSLELVFSFLKFVEDANPRFWLLENNPYLSEYIGVPRIVTHLSPKMLRAFWGNYPGFLVPMQNKRELTENVSGKLRSWKRAKIPVCVSEALGKAVRCDLEYESS